MEGPPVNRLAAVLVFVAAAGCTAGYPPPPGGARAIAHEAPHVVLLGDSITNQMFWAIGAGPGAPADVETFAGLGWHAATPAVPRALAAEAAADDLDLLVLALGTNDSADGWTSADVAAWRRLVDLVPADVCIRVVLPHHTAPGLTPERTAHLLATRAGITAVMGDRPVTYADWQATIDRVGTGILAPDGVHLRDDPATGRPAVDAARARAGTYWPGLDRCGPIPGVPR